MTLLPVFAWSELRRNEMSDQVDDVAATDGVAVRSDPESSTVCGGSTLNKGQ
jgi:hypothetical protein